MQVALRKQEDETHVKGNDSNNQFSSTTTGQSTEQSTDLPISDTQKLQLHNNIHSQEILQNSDVNIHVTVVEVGNNCRTATNENKNIEHVELYELVKNDLSSDLLENSSEPKKCCRKYSECNEKCVIR